MHFYYVKTKNVKNKTVQKRRHRHFSDFLANNKKK
jgi:hypothetical protein